MSYTKTFSTVISVPYSGSVSTKNGFVSYSGTAHETVHVNIHVDTDDFEASVGNCGDQVSLLTGSVVATKTAHAESIRINSRKISDTIISGFFKTVRSELGQQISQLKSRTEATLLHLNQLAARCREKHQQMETDYNRLVDRYSKVFADLNKELEIRVHELDRAAFTMQATCTDCSNRSVESDLTGVATVSAAETARTQSSLLASVTKKRALDAINQANDYLMVQQQCRNVINRSLHDPDTDRRYYVPVCMAEGVDSDTHSATKSFLFKPSVIPNSSRRRMLSELKNARWKQVAPCDMTQIKREYARNVTAATGDDSSHGRRVRAYLNRFIDNTILSL